MMTRWLVLFSFFLAACGSNNVPPDTKPEDIESDEGSDDASGDDGSGDDGSDDDDLMASPDEVDDDLDGFTEVDGDCDDTDDTIFPGAEEAPADGVDQDCDGNEVCFADADDDGILSEDTPTIVSADGDCNDAYEGTSADLVGDCDDTDAAVGMPSTWYSDLDTDGLGDATYTLEACEQPDGYVDNDADPCTIIDGSAGGAGTEDDPFIVCDATTLQNIDLDLSAHYLQTIDIDLTDTAIVPLADMDFDLSGGVSEDTPPGFSGHYDGNGHTLVGLELNEADAATDVGKPTALFRYVGPTGVIEDLRLEDVEVRSRNGASALVGILMGAVRQINVGGLIDISGNNNVAGVVGVILAVDEDFPAEISDVHVGTGNVTNRGLGSGPPAELGLGGILANGLGGSVTNSSSAINVTWERSAETISHSISYSPAAGGAVGRALFLTVSDVHTSGDIEGIHNVGGVIGTITNRSEGECTLSRLTSSGEILGVGEDIGGVAGELAGEACYLGSTGTIQGNHWVGGIAGQNHGEAHCDQCFSSANIVVIEGEFSASSGAGGLLGYSSEEGTMTNSIYTGTLTKLTSDRSIVGGLLGVSLLGDDPPLSVQDSIMIGSVETDDGGLILGAAVSLDGSADPERYFSNNVYIDHDTDRLPDTADGSSSMYDLYWGDEVTQAELEDFETTTDSFDFGSIWTMVTTTDADSPLYGLSHPALVWQCEYDTSIICDILD